MSRRRSPRSGATPSRPSSPRWSVEQRATAVTSSMATSNCGASVSWRNATAQPASAPSRYAVGLGARFSPPSVAGRSASQLNAPGRQPRPPVGEGRGHGRGRAGGRRVGPELGLGLGEHGRGHRWHLRPTPHPGVRGDARAVPPPGEPRQHPIGGEPRACRLAAGTQPSGDVAADVARGRGRARGATADAELRVDVGQVALDRPDAQRQRVGDLLVRPAVGDQPQDVELARRERLDRPLGLAGSRTTAGPARGTPRPRP